jgi:DNA topoisomerase-1
MDLVIVESPAKAKTIEGFLGKGFTVKSSYGHVRDLAKKGVAIDVENNFEPNYEVLPDKKKIVAELKSLAKKSDIVWLATDEDREGEAISWHLSEVLGLTPEKTKRIVFHEITKAAIKKAVGNPRELDIDLVKAQQARRVLDRLVGFELSPVLWRKVKPSLSAGRVQSVTVRLIVERERAIRDYKSEVFYRVTGFFNLDNGSAVKANISEKFKSEEEAYAFLEKCKDASFKVESVVSKPAKKSPAPPFTTSSLQQEASRKLGFSVNQTMVVAQHLYEAGKITYMRTDSFNLSDLAMTGSQDAIESMYGKEYSNPRKFTTKSKGAQEAHEAIRPTYLDKDTVTGDRNEERLYSLIWKRTIASQMADAQLEKTTVKIGVSLADKQFTAQGEVIKFDGFLKVYQVSTDEDVENAFDSGMLPEMKEGDNLNLDSATGVQRFTMHPPRYSEASLVKKLEELGIGRPSTYAPTISTIQKRGYVEKKSTEGVQRDYNFIEVNPAEITTVVKTETTGKEKNKLFPTDIGEVVNDFLIEHFENVLNFNFTADVEREFDQIADGNVSWNKMIEGFYSDFHKKVEHTIEHSERATGERLLGEDPETGKPVYARIGRFGPMIQIGHVDDEEKPKFTSLIPPLKISSVTFEEAMELFKLPRMLGEYEGKKLYAAIGRFGPYLRLGSMFVSIKEVNGDNPYTITYDRGAVLIKEKIEADKKALLKTFDEDEDLRIIEGRYGPYIKLVKDNYKILPKGTDPLSLSYQDCLDMIAKQPKKTKGKAKKAPVKKKAPAKKKVVAKKKPAVKKKAVAKKKPAKKA